MKIYSLLSDHNLVVECDCMPRCNCSHEDKPPRYTERSYEYDPERRCRTNRITRLERHWRLPRRNHVHHAGCHATDSVDYHRVGCPNQFDSQSSTFANEVRGLILNIFPLHALEK